MNRLRGSLLPAVLTLTACSPMYLAARPPVDISGYRGDGNILRLQHPINPGFQVDFEPFWLATPYTATYRLDGLPKPRHQSDYRFGLVADLSKSELSTTWPHVPTWLTTGVVGTLALEATEANGRTGLTCQGQVSTLHWNWLTGELPLGEIRSDTPLQCDTSRVSSVREKGEQLVKLKVTYVPGPDAPERKARIRATAGGFD